MNNALATLRAFSANRQKAMQRARPGPRRRRNRVNPGAKSLLPNEAHQCALHYGEALIDPFNTPAGACVPKFPTVESAKRVLFAAGTGSTNASGTGGIVVGSNASSDTYSSFVTNSNYTESGELPAYGDTGISAITMNSAFTNAELGATGSVQTRLVALGVRIRYVGSKLNEGGRAYTIEEPSHEQVAGMTLANMLKYDKCAVQKCNFNSEWVSVVYQPRFPGDFAYVADRAGQTSAESFLGIYIASAVAEQPFEYEIYAHYEFIGSSVRGKSISHNAPMQVDKILSALSQAPPGAMRKIQQRGAARQVAARTAVSGASFWQKAGMIAGGLLGGPVGSQIGGLVGGLI